MLPNMQICKYGQICPAQAESSESEEESSSLWATFLDCLQLENAPWNIIKSSIDSNSQKQPAHKRCSISQHISAASQEVEFNEAVYKMGEGVPAGAVPLHWYMANPSIPRLSKDPKIYSAHVSCNPAQHGLGTFKPITILVSFIYLIMVLLFLALPPLESYWRKLSLVRLKLSDSQTDFFVLRLRNLTSSKVALHGKHGKQFGWAH